MNSPVPKNFRLLFCLILAGLWPVSIRANQGISRTPAGFHFKNAPVPPVLAAGNSFLLQDAGDQAQVLQICLNLAALQPYYPKNKKGEIDRQYVLQHGISFPADMAVAVAGKTPAFLDKAALAKEEPPAYFLFYEFALTGNTARVEFVYNYDQASALKKMLVAALELQKTGGTWTIVKQKTEERES